MTYRQKLIESLRTVRIQPIEHIDAEGRTNTRAEMEILPLTFVYFIHNISALMVYIANKLLSQDYGGIYFGDDLISNGKPIKDPTVYDILRVLTHNDLVRATTQTIQSQEFFRWLLEQPAIDDDIERMWYDFDVLALLWNQHAETHSASGKEDDNG